MPMLVLSVESQEANDRGVPEKLIASWSDTGRSKCRLLIRRRSKEDESKKREDKISPRQLLRFEDCHSQSAHCVETIIIITTILVLILYPNTA